MIEINLLPEELRIKVRTKSPEQVIVKNNTGFNPDQLFIYAIPAILGVFVLVHLYFAAIGIFKNNQLVSLNQKWLKMEPQKKILDEFNKEFSSSSQDASISKTLTSQRILWAQKLNNLSLNLVAGVWFNDISINSKNITIQGSVVSLKREEVSLINRLLDNLKADTEFSKDFSGFELSNVQKRNIEGYDIADFVFTGALKTK